MLWHQFVRRSVACMLSLSFFLQIPRVVALSFSYPLKRRQGGGLVHPHEVTLADR